MAPSNTLTRTGRGASPSRTSKSSSSASVPSLFFSVYFICFSFSFSSITSSWSFLTFLLFLLHPLPFSHASLSSTPKHSEIFHMCCFVGIGISDAEIRQLMDEADLNKDGEIDFKEVLAISLPFPRLFLSYVFHFIPFFPLRPYAFCLFFSISSSLGICKHCQPFSCLWDLLFSTPHRVSSLSLL